MDDAVDPEKLAVARRVAGDLIIVLPAVRVRSQVLAAVLEPAHGMTELEREPCNGDLLAPQHAFEPESAPNVGRDHPDGSIIHAQAFRQARLNRVRNLRRRRHREKTQPRIPMRNDTAALEREGALAGGADVPRDLDRRSLQRSSRHALFADLNEHVVAPGLVHQRRAGLSRGQHVR